MAHSWERTLERCEIECLHPRHVGPLIGRVIDDPAAEDLAATFELLADPTRARIIHALSLATALCVCDLAWLLGISRSGLSHQLRLLRDRRVVERRRVGRIVYYRLRDAHVRRLVRDGLRYAHEMRPIAKSPRAAAGGARR